jgi:ubiquinone biosynthesis protein UbiJ
MVMTDEEQTKLVAALQNPEHDRFPLRTARDAAKEIERLAKRVEKLEARLEAMERRFL